MSAVELNGVWKTRGRGRQASPALRDVALRIEAGEFAIIEGPSGVGKTTLLGVAAGLLRPDAGTVRLGGVLLQGLTGAAQRRHRARCVGFVFQRSNLLDALTVRENVLLMASLAGMPRRRAEAETQRLLEELGLAPLAERRPVTLSGGEEQRVAIARALVHGPAVVLADEPTGSLDSAAGCAVAVTLQALARAQGAAVIAVTHDPRLAAYGTRRMRMVDGRLTEPGATAGLRPAPREARQPGTTR
jgi:putative ABC transport system ATP-binding protein